MARLQDGVFGELLKAADSEALTNLDMQKLASTLFDLGR